MKPLPLNPFQELYNPFQELYVTDSAEPRVFVRLFSDFLLQHALPLFRPGNAVIVGTQGAGKSMLLNLLKPQIREAYYDEGVPFPVPDADSNFLSAGINLAKSGALDFGQRPIVSGIEQEMRTFPLFFADFINYFVVDDILESVRLIRRRPEVFRGTAGPGNLDNFAAKLSAMDCWAGYLSDCRTFEALVERVRTRIRHYRRFHSTWMPLNTEIAATLTTIGEPLASTAECLRQTSAIGESTILLIRVDQIDRLTRGDTLRRELGLQYRQVLNKALGNRDSRVNYRIGARHFTWNQELRIFGSEEKIEHHRDYRFIDLDEALTQRENRRGWIFPGFAEDAFMRRLSYSGFHFGEEKDTLGRVFGPTMPHEQAAYHYTKHSKPDAVLKWPAGIPDRVRKWALELYAQENGRLDAFLLTAWVAQKIVSDPEAVDALDPGGELPYKKSVSWQKERNRQALLQMAARSRQHLRWCGRDQIIALSGGNISILFVICHQIWEAYLREARVLAARGTYEPQWPIDPEIQSVGIDLASKDWYEKIDEQPDGRERRNFVNVLGILFRSKLLEDPRLSYPGHNGFSLSKPLLDEHPEVWRYLTELTDLGDLQARDHTTKESDRQPRTKWYLAPIFAPHFQITETHIKEPYYANIGEIYQWLQAAKVRISYQAGIEPANPRRKRAEENSEPGLFDSLPSA